MEEYQDFSKLAEPRYKQVVVWEDDYIIGETNRASLGKLPDHHVIFSLPSGTGVPNKVMRALLAYGKSFWWNYSNTRCYYLLDFNTAEDAAMFRLKWQ